MKNIFCLILFVLNILTLNAQRVTDSLEEALEDPTKIIGLHYTCEEEKTSDSIGELINLTKLTIASTTLAEISGNSKT